MRATPFLLVAATLAAFACTKSTASKDAASPATPPAPAAAADAAEPATPPVVEPAADLARCCEQCARAGSKDPAGMDISTKGCRSYAGEFMGEPGVDEACMKFFESRPTTLGDCWKLAPDADL